MPAQLTYPGVYVEEIPSGVRTITGVPTSVAAFVGRAKSGPVNAPIVINGFSDFDRRFGGLDRDSAMSYAVDQFFANGGGQAVIVRVTHNDAATATFDLADGGAAGGPALALQAASPGSWADELRITVNHQTRDPADATLFNLILTLSRPTGPVVERWLNLSTQPAQPRYAPVVLEQSALVRARRDANGDYEPVSQPAEVAGAAPTGAGADGGDLTEADLIGDEGAQTGMYALARADIFNVLCLPPPTRDADVSSDAFRTAQTFCRSHRAVVLVDAGSDWTLDNAAEKKNALMLGTDSEYGAVYFPRLLIRDRLSDGPPAAFPPSGAVAGAIARTDVDRGVWKAPAGVDVGLNVDGVSVNLTDPESGEVNPIGVNAIRTLTGYGTVVWGARTLAGADALGSEYKYLPVRRTALFIEETLFRALKWVVFEPNDEPLWRSIRLNVAAFMNELFRRGAFEGTTPAAAYFVKCDHETTTQNDIDLGIVNIVVGFAPLKPAEFVVIQIQQIAGQIQT